MNINFKPYGYDITKAYERKNSNLSIEPVEIDNILAAIQDNNVEISNGKYDGTVVYIKMSFIEQPSVQDNSLFAAYHTCHEELLSIFSDNPDFVDFAGDDDCFYAIFRTSLRPQIDSVIETVGKINSVLSLLNAEFFPEINITLNYRIGVDFNELFVFKDIMKSDNNTFYSRNWFGKALRCAKKMAKLEGKEEANIIVSNRIFKNLKEEYQKFFDAFDDYYMSNVVNAKISNWIKSKR